jgi:hypothetical protein
VNLLSDTRQILLGREVEVLKKSAANISSFGWRRSVYLLAC